MNNEETITITETAPDGTTTTIEITSTKPDDAADGGESLVEEVVEALLDTEIPDDNDADAAATDEVSDTEVVLADDASWGEPDYEAATETDSAATDTATDTPVVETPVETPYETAEPVDASTAQEPVVTDAGYAPFVAAPTDSSYTDSSTDTTEAEVAPTEEDAAAAEQEAHAEAAREAQAAADEFVAEGDYAAAAEARETAENEAWEAGDQSMLGTSDSSDLDNAAYRQEQAEYYEEQQSQHAQAGDYEAAREDAGNAAYHTGEADFLAGGDDHTGQAKAEEAQMEWAVYHEEIADSNAQSAEEYAAAGDFENAQMYAENAVEEQGMADYHGDMGEHGGDMAVYDPSSDVASGGTYDASADAVDYSSTAATDYSSTTDYSSE